jgi:hypothetical protein
MHLFSAADMYRLHDSSSIRARFETELSHSNSNVGTLNSFAETCVSHYTTKIEVLDDLLHGTGLAWLRSERRRSRRRIKSITLTVRSMKN